MVIYLAAEDSRIICLSDDCLAPLRLVLLLSLLYGFIFQIYRGRHCLDHVLETVVCIRQGEIELYLAKRWFTFIQEVDELDGVLICFVLPHWHLLVMSWYCIAEVSVNYEPCGSTHVSFMSME